ncbi:MAG: hypothetical protein ABSF90_15595 [Syntrophobacteraceae bacterium]
MALEKQNTQALAKDLGREPQPWEVYLARQQGVGGATALINVDPNASAASVLGGSTDKLTLNGIPADAMAGQALSIIRGYVDKHAQMYEANGVPTAQNIADNYETQLQGVIDQAQRDFPGDFRMQQLYVSHYQQQAGLALHAQQMSDRANSAVILNPMTGPNPVSSAAPESERARNISPIQTLRSRTMPGAQHSWAHSWDSPQRTDLPWKRRSPGRFLIGQKKRVTRPRNLSGCFRCRGLGRF